MATQIETIRRTWQHAILNHAVAGLIMVGTMLSVLPTAHAQMGAQMGEETLQAADMHPFGDATTALSGAGMLHSTPNTLTATLHTSGLDPNAAYTVWAVVFNNPGECTAGTDPRPTVVCGSPDLTATPNMAAASAFLIGSFVTSDNGTINTQVTLQSGPLAEGTAVLWGIDGINDNGVTPGLTIDNGLSAEVHFVLRTHGELIPGSVAEQLSTFNGGCPPNTCANQQAVSFPPAVMTTN